MIKMSKFGKGLKRYFGRQNTVVSLIIAVAVQSVALCLLESFTYDFTYLGILKFIYNLIFWLSTFALFTFVSGSLRIGSIINVLISATLGSVEYFVMTSRNSPILPWDLLSLGTALSVANNYKFEFNTKIFILYGVYLLLIIASVFCTLKIKRKKLLIRSVGALLCCALLFGFAELSQVTDFQDAVGYYPYLFTPKAVYKRNGFAFSFCSLLKYVNPEAPEGYDVNELEAYASQYETEDNEDGENNDEYGIDGKLPNIIVIMDEAFSDLSVLGDVDASEEYLDFFNSLTENTVKGYVYSSVNGGNTANSEYEFLTGDTMAFLPSGSIPYQQYIKSDYETYVETLNSLGYYTCSMHPYYSSGWCRSSVYEFFGFQKQFYRSAYGEDDMREYVSDRQCFEHLITVYERRSKRNPFFAFCVTMQNHGGYSTSTDFDNFNQRIKSSISDGVSSYLSLISYTDDALEYLINHFKNVDEPTVICFFGDHLPTSFITSPVLSANGLGSADELPLEDYTKLYKVPFVIWANYDIEEKTVEKTSLNYLSILVSETANIPLSPYQKFLKELSEKYPVITANFSSCVDSENEFDYNECFEDDEAFLSYNRFQYNHLFGKDKKLEGFFSIE